MPEILDPYNISDLPQTSSPLSSRLAVAFGLHSKVYFGISHSSLTGYSLKTTARPLWTHPVSPITTITAICTGVSSASHEASHPSIDTSSNTNVIYYASINPKGKASLHQLAPKIDAQGESQEITLLQKCDYISAIQASKSLDNSTVLYLVYGSGQVQALSIESNPDDPKDLKVSPIWSIPPPSSSSSSSKKNYKVLFTKFLKAPSKDLPQDGLAVTISSPSKNSKQFTVSVVSLDSSEGRVLSTQTVQISTAEELGVFDIAGTHLFRYVASSASIYRYNLLDPTVTPQYVMTLPTNSKIDQASSSKSVPNQSSVLFIGNDQVLVSHGSVLRLVDLKYSVLLSERVLSQPISLISYNKKLSLTIGNTLPSPSDSLTTNNEKIMAIPLDIGTGSLLESIGKGVSQPSSLVSDSAFRNSFAQIPTVFRETSASLNMVKEESTLVKNAHAEASALLSVLRHFLDTQNMADFEKWALAYFKITNKWIKAVGPASKPEDIISKTTVPELPFANSSDASDTKKIFYKAKHDRAVDSTFLYDLCTIIFKHVGVTGTSPLSSLVPGDIGVNDISSSSLQPSKKTVKLVKLRKNFAPERLICYLLTHPLLPTQQLPGLLLTLNRFPDLVRVALKRAPAALRCDTVVSALRARDDDTFISAAIRLEHRFDAHQIISALKRVYISTEGKIASDSSLLKSKKSAKSKSKSANSTPENNSTKPFLDITYPDNGTTLETIIRRMVSLDLGWSLMPYFIDAGGLFGWDEEFLSFLDESVSERLDMYKSTGYEVVAMLEESLRQSNRRGSNLAEDASVNDTTKSEPFGSKQTEPFLVSAKQQTQQRLKAILPIGFANKYAYGKKAASNPSGSRAASAIASYTVERLLL